MAQANRFIYLNRAVLRLSGEDARALLQNIITNDIRKVTHNQAIYSALLTPQGKFLFDFFISEWQGALYMECDASAAAALLTTLNRYKLRAKVMLEEVTKQYQVIVLLGEQAIALLGTSNAGDATPLAGGIGYIDPRTSALYARLVVPQEVAAEVWESQGFSQGMLTEYEQLRIHAGVPEGYKDLLPEQAFPLEYGLKELNAIDFKKGCYVGQEVTARTEYRGKVKKQIYRVEADEALPEARTDITAGEHRLGMLTSSLGKHGLALLNVEDTTKAQAAGEKLLVERVVIRVSPSNYTVYS